MTTSFQSAVRTAVLLFTSVLLAACGGSSNSTSSDPITVALSSIAPSSGSLSPDFDPNTTSYDLTTDLASISLTTGNAELDASLNATVEITVNGQSVTPGTSSGQINLNPGINTITVFVLASTENDSASRTYTIRVYRQSTNNDLDELTVRNGNTNFLISFNGSQSNPTYSTTVPNDITSVDVTPTVVDANATVTVDGNAVASGSSVTVSGLVSTSINTIPVVVTAENGDARSYSLQVERELNDDTSIAALEVTGIGGPYTVTQNGTNFSATVPHLVTSIDIKPSLSSPNSTVTVNGIATNSGGTVTVSGLEESDENAIPIVVTAEDNDQLTYILRVNRQSNDARLDSLEVVGETLSPAFSPSVLSYDVTVGTTSIDINATTNNGNAQITIDGQSALSGVDFTQALNIGLNQIDIVITAQDNSNSETYTLQVTRLSNVADLSGLSMTAYPNVAAVTLVAVTPEVITLTPAFSPAQTSYTASVANAFVNVTSTPSTNPANNATGITVNGVAVASGVESGATALVVGDNPAIDIEVTAEDGATTKNLFGGCASPVRRCEPVGSDVISWYFGSGF